MLFSYFNDVLRIFSNAEQNGHVVDRFYKIAHHSVRLRFTGQILADVLSPSLEHVSTESVSLPSLTACLLDMASANAVLPPFPWEENTSMKKNIQSAVEGTNPVIYFKDERILGAYQIGTKALSMLDTRLNQAVFCMPDARSITYYERSAPLRTIFQWWAKINNLQFVHAGAVGIDGCGVLLAGQGGSGKSTTALNCLSSGLCYVSDDYCVVEMGARPYAHSIYCSAKVDTDGMNRFPGLASVAENTRSMNEEKFLLLLNKQYSEKIVKGFSVCAIVIPRVGGFAKTRLIPVSSSKGLMALAPSTIFQMRGANQADLTFMAELTRIVPNFLLELGEDTDRVPEIILNLLSNQ